ncbi:MAG: Rpn family recombination-promoting nuclease/putative transposase [Treponema sp.]
MNVEMQTRNYNGLPQRARFYQSVGDVNSLAPGELYGTLIDHYVIFICTFDLFKLDFPKYTFYYTCKESKDLLLKDGSCIIFMNTSVSEKSDLKSFHDYIEKRGSAERLAGKFNSAIAQLKENDDKRRYYMTYTSRIMEAKIDGQKLGEKIGETRGINIGRTQGIDNTIAKFYKAGLSVADIAKATGLSDEQIMNVVKGAEAGQ